MMLKHPCIQKLKSQLIENNITKKDIAKAESLPALIGQLVKSCETCVGVVWVDFLGFVFSRDRPVNTPNLSILARREMCWSEMYGGVGYTTVTAVRLRPLQPYDRYDRFDRF